MELRRYSQEDLQEVVRLFCDTVRYVNAKDYSERQVRVWSDAGKELLKKNDYFLSLYTLIATENTQIVGYGNIDGSGYLDHLYVHKAFQGLHIASTLCDSLEDHAVSLNLKEITVNASITARPFFEKRGYETVKEQYVIRQRIKLKNYYMKKHIASAALH